MQNEIRQICPISTSRIVVIGWSTAFNVNVVDLKADRVIWTDLAFEPSISPNGRWLVYREFHPANSEVPISDVYRVLDLGDPQGSKEPRVLYPLVREGTNFLDVPDSLVHSSASQHFSWSADSNFVVFVDTVANSRYLVLVELARSVIRPYTMELNLQDGEWIPYTSPDCYSGSLTNVGRVTADSLDDFTIAVKAYSGEDGCHFRRKDILRSALKAASVDVFPQKSRRSAKLKQNNRSQ